MSESRTKAPSLLVLAAAAPIACAALLGVTASSATALTAVPAQCAINQTLRYGSTGAQVRLLQAGVGSGVDGIFGRNTENAVKAFQSRHSLPATGVVDKATVAAFGCTVAGGTPTAGATGGATAGATGGATAGETGGATGAATATTAPTETATTTEAPTTTATQEATTAAAATTAEATPTVTAPASTSHHGVSPWWWLLLPLILLPLLGWLLWRRRGVDEYETRQAAPVRRTEQPVVREPAKPVVRETTKPVVREPAKPVVREPAKPVVRDTTTKPLVGETAKPVVREPAKPVVPPTAHTTVRETPRPVVDTTREVRGTTPVIRDLTGDVEDGDVEVRYLNNAIGDHEQSLEDKSDDD